MYMYVHFISFKYKLFSVTAQALCKCSNNIFAKQLGPIEDTINKVKVRSHLFVDPLVFTQEETIAFIPYATLNPQQATEVCVIALILK